MKRHTERLVALQILCAVLLGAGLSRSAPAAPARTVADACRGVPEAESHLAVLLSPDDVLRVEPLGPRDHAADPTVPVGEGARIVLASRPFVTPDWLQRVVDCHLSRASGGKPGTDRSPLDVAGTSVLVTGAPGTLTVTIATRDRHAAREVIARARALVPAR
jgi:hypothetical protein